MKDPQTYQTKYVTCHKCFGRGFFIHFCDLEVDPHRCEKCLGDGFLEDDIAYSNKQDEIEIIQTQER